MRHRPRIHVSVFVLVLTAGACAPSSEKGSANRLVELKLNSNGRTRIAAQVSAVRSTTDESRPRAPAFRTTVSKVESPVGAALESAAAGSLIDVIIGVRAPRPIPQLPALDQREMANSVSENSVFENAMVEGPMAPGKWTIRLVGARIPQPQIAYYAAYAGGGSSCQSVYPVGVFRNLRYSR